MKNLNLIFSLIIIVVSVVLCQQIISNSRANQQNNEAYAELNHIKYGFFSVAEWKRQVSVILVDEISKLDFSRKNERDIKKHVETMLNDIIDEVAKKIKEGNEGTAVGWVKQSLINIFVSMDDIKKGIPEYADSIVKEMTTEQTTGQIKDILNKQLKEYLNTTTDTQDTSQISGILLRTDSKDVKSAKIQIDKAIAVKHAVIVKESVILIILSVILFALSGFSIQPLTPIRYLLLVISLIILLIAGVTTPMIDMEAKVSQLSFMLMGHSIHFENQVLYFQSKSVIDVFWVLITGDDIQMKFVGILVITFSVFFPVLKIFSSFVYYYDFHRARENPVIKFFVLKSGKWSMADVMVVAIFMSYIGFSGIISSQLQQLTAASQDVVVLTTNGTALKPGYYLFLTYTLLALFLAGYLTRQEKESVS